MTTQKTAFQPFTLGQIVATRGVIASVPPHRLTEALARHTRGDWGTVCAEDAASNNEATFEGLRILSAYPIDPALVQTAFGSSPRPTGAQPPSFCQKNTKPLQRPGANPGRFFSSSLP